MGKRLEDLQKSPSDKKEDSDFNKSIEQDDSKGSKGSKQRSPVHFSVDLSDLQ